MDMKKALYGGRVEPKILVAAPNEEFELRYSDIVSEYPTVLKVCKFDI